MRSSAAKYLFLSCVMGAMLADVSHAGLLYSAIPNQSGGSDANGFLEADDFTIAGPTPVTRITFWSFQTIAADYTGSVAWSFRSDAAGMPGASVVSGTATPVGAATGRSAFGLNEFQYSLVINTNLNAGTYWLVLHNGPNNAIPPTDFFWEWSNGNAGNSMSQDLASPNQPWLGNFAELAVQITDVPEPASVFLAGAGLLAVWLGRRRQYN